MYVCVCNGVSEQQIRNALYNGCSNYREVRNTLGVASKCGKCACQAKKIVRQTLNECTLERHNLIYSQA